MIGTITQDKKANIVRAPKINKTPSPVFGDFPYLLLIFLFQLGLSFFGLDTSDEGFLAIFYRYIFSDPESVTYNFLFWFAGVIGGIWEKFFGGLGLWGLRVFGALVFTAIVWCSLRLLRKYVTDPRHLKFSLFIVLMITIINDVRIFNYNMLSTLLFVLTAYQLCAGTIQGKQKSFFWAGLMIGISTFVRLPNILEAGAIMLVAAYNRYNGTSFRTTIRQGLILGTGIAVSSAALVGMIWILGHQTYFLDAYGYLTKMSDTANVAQNEKELYGFAHILQQTRIGLTKPLKYAVLFLSALFAAEWLISFVRDSRKAKWIATTIHVIVFLALTILFLRERMNSFDLLFGVTGISLIMFIPHLLSTSKPREKFLYALGVYFTVTYPIGSSSGIYSAGNDCLWISFPIAMEYFLRISGAKTWFHMDNRSGTTAKLHLYLQPGAWRRIQMNMSALILSTSIICTYLYSFCDWTPKINMTAPLSSNHLKFIYTTPERAKLINEMLEQIPAYVQPNGYFISFANIPITYYATDRRPLLHNSYPFVYKAALFQEDLHNSVAKHGLLPPIVRQIKPNMGIYSHWPFEDPKVSYGDLSELAGITNVLDRFIVDNKYVSVWRNSYFEILVHPDTEPVSLPPHGMVQPLAK